MMNSAKQTAFLDHLERVTGVFDVYLHKSVLYVINAYDEEAVSEFLKEFEYNAILSYDVVNAYDDELMAAYG